MKREDFKYKKCSHEIVLNAKHKAERVRIVSSWIHENVIWETVTFNDQKRFNLDGPDNWMSYTPKSKKCIRQTRQCKGGGIMVWLMVMKNHLLSYYIIDGKFKSKDYVSMLDVHCVPYLKLNFGQNVTFQEDNCSVHKAHIVKEF